MIEAGDSFSRRRIGRLAGLAETVAAQQEHLGVLHQAIGDDGRDGRIEHSVAQSENAVFVVMIVDRFSLCRVEMT